MEYERASDIVFDEGDGVINKSPYELTKKQIWYKCFQRCFDEGSKQMSNSYDQQGMVISQPEIFMNSVTMFQIMAIGTLMRTIYTSLFAQLSSIDDRIKAKEEAHKIEARELVAESQRNPDKRIDVSKTLTMLDDKFKKESVLLFREKLGILSVLMEKEQYLDAKGGLQD